jgi:hypothetical protein
MGRHVTPASSETAITPASPAATTLVDEAKATARTGLAAGVTCA